MARITLRQLLDHAAERGYGVAAFNVNNMEQIQAIMEAAKETDSPVIIQASRGARYYSQGQLSQAPDDRRVGAVSADSDRHAPGPRQQPGDLHVGDRQRLYSVMMDGSLKDDGKTPPTTTTT